MAACGCDRRSMKLAAATPTEIVLIRHGETAWNADRRIQGHLDIPLNDVGHRQAEALGRRFRSEAFDALYSSDLQRALLTADRIAGQRSPVRQDSRLRERHLGVLQGLTRAEALARHASAWEAFKRRQPDEPLEGGESLGAFSRRVQEFLQSVCRLHSGQRVVIVTHGGLLDAAYRLATGRAMDASRDFPILNAAVNTLIHQGRWQLKNWGDTGHLDEKGEELAGAGADFIDHAGR